ncbi:MAG: class I SAM-dependent methyltransferase [Pseudomonadota bacterium]
MTAVRLDEAVWQAVRQQASEPYRQAGRLAYHFARGKLEHDPMFRALLERGDLLPQARVLDLGCGQGLIAAVLHAAHQLHRAGQWPAQPPAPLGCVYQGFELMPAVVQRAERALASSFTQPRFACVDVSRANLPPSDLILLLDVLHYVELPAQQGLLQRIRQALAPEGRLVLRVGDAAESQRHSFSQWVDRWVVRARGHGAQPHFGRPLSSWVALLQDVGFAVDSLPMSQGTPFSNVLLVAHVPARATLTIEDTAA